MGKDILPFKTRLALSGVALVTVGCNAVASMDRYGANMVSLYEDIIEVKLP